MSTVPLLAFEVMDKELSARVLLSIFALLGAFSFLAGLWRRWAAVVILIVIALFTGNVAIELRDPFVGPAIWAEAGWDWVAALCGGFLFSSLFAILGLWVRSKQLNRGVRG